MMMERGEEFVGRRTIGLCWFFCSPFCLPIKSQDRSETARPRQSHLGQWANVEPSNVDPFSLSIFDGLECRWCFVLCVELRHLSITHRSRSADAAIDAQSGTNCRRHKCFVDIFSTTPISTRKIETFQPIRVRHTTEFSFVWRTCGRFESLFFIDFICVCVCVCVENNAFWSKIQLEMIFKNIFISSDRERLPCVCFFASRRFFFFNFQPGRRSTLKCLQSNLKRIKANTIQERKNSVIQRNLLFFFLSSERQSRRKATKNSTRETETKKKTKKHHQRKKKQKTIGTIKYIGGGRLCKWTELYDYDLFI